MSEAPQERGAAAAPREPAPPRRPLGQRLLVAALVVAVILLAYIISAQTIPRWWAHRIGDQVRGSGTAGIALGLFYGFVFTFLPLLVLSIALRRGRPWRLRAWLAALAVVLALPNLFTLGIVLGSGSAAHAGQRTLDVNAPYFRGSTLAGAVVGALAVLGVRALIDSRRRHKLREKRLRDELRARDQAVEPAAEPRTDKRSS